MSARDVGVESRQEGVIGDDRALVLRGVDKRYGAVHALKAADLAVARGEVHAIVGENGAGKSTLVGAAAGTVVIDSGTVALGEAVSDAPDPNWAKEHGLAVVYQEPALLGDLSVAENMRLALPEELRPSASDQVEWTRARLAEWQEIVAIDAGRPVRELDAAQRFVVEIVRALEAEPNVLILDEPTEHLLPAAVEALFERLRAIVARGAAVVYISHRIHEVKRIADRITVLRDGAVMGTFVADEVTEDDVVDLIVGQKLEARFPPKAEPEQLGDPLLEVRGAGGRGFHDVDLRLRAGEIVGLGGIEGNGQRPFLRAVAGLSSREGTLAISGRPLTGRGVKRHSDAGIVYVSADRRDEGVLAGLSVRENLTVRAISRLSAAGIMRRDRESQATRDAVAEYRIKAASPEAPIESLSGGNQQKVMLSRAMLAEPRIVLADEPSQGVDVGARADVYQILRAATDEGAAVCVLSSDASELEGLCDRVLVFSRGRVVRELLGDDVTERNITEAAITTTSERLHGATASGALARCLRLIDRDIAPSAVLAVLLAVLAVVAAVDNEFYFTGRNFGLMLPLFAALAFFAIGQQLVLLTGGIDLSVGPLAGLLSVIASLTVAPDVAGGGLVLGILALVGVAILVGALNWALVVAVGINPIIATLVTYTALQGVALMIQPTPDGAFSTDVTDPIESAIGIVPWVAIIAVVCAIGLELALYRTLFGLRVRGVGCAAPIARKVGVRPAWVTLGCYVGCSIFALAGALVLLPQLGSGNATGANSYSLASITAVVLGGASIFGGRGSFVGAVLGAALIVQINTVVQFLGLTDYWQQFVLGGLTIAAVALYSTARTATQRRNAHAA